jgi:large subunit ribosomal protein L18e
MRKGPTSYTTRGLINEFEKLARTKKKPLYKRVANELKKSRRQKRRVNLSKINRYSIKNSNILVLGKVLGSGDLKHPVKITAFEYSKTAVEKLKNSKSSVSTLKDWIKNPKIPRKVIILG